MFDEMLTEFETMKAELLKRQVELSVSIRPKFHEAFALIFKRHPKLENITFTAYTPYFNDGDECVYSVNEPEMSACGIEDIESYSAGTIAKAAEFQRTGVVPAEVKSDYSRWASSRYDSPETYLRSTAAEYLKLDASELEELGAIAGDFPAVQAILEAVPEEVMKGMFGDHVKVVITADAVEVDEYDHD